MDERRRERRFDSVEKVMATLPSPTDEEDEAESLACFSADISESGLRLRTDRRIAIGRPIRLWVKVVDRPGTLSLAGLVRWCEPHESGKEFWVGIAITEEPHTEWDSWREMLARWAQED